MLILKFQAWVTRPLNRENPQAAPAARDHVIECTGYEVQQFPELKQQIVTVRRPSALPDETFVLAEPEAATQCPYYRKLYVMNDQGKTIDSYSSERVIR